MSTPPATYRRFSLDQRIEHLLVLVSFITLAVTGLPQKYIGQPWADGLFALLGGIELTRITHRLAATVLMLETVYHLASVGYRVIVLRRRMSMLPNLQDVRDAWQALRHNLGLEKSRPQMGRYTFDEKAEYWSLVWGTAIMVITGFIMWNPIASARLLPGEIIPAAKAAHGGEALLAVLAIIVWHMYHVHLKTFNRSMFTGQLNAEQMHHDHPLELADLKAGLAQTPVEPAAMRQRQRWYLPVAGVLAVVLLAGVYAFTTFEQTAITTLPERATVVAFVPQTPTPFPTPLPTETPNPADRLVWEGYIGRVLQQKCGQCHGSSGELSLRDYAELLKGGASGPAIVVGNAADSLLVKSQQAGGHPGQFNSDQLSKVMEWIDQGAPEQ